MPCSNVNTTFSDPTRWIPLTENSPRVQDSRMRRRKGSESKHLAQPVTCLVTGLLLLSAGCSGSLYKVKPITELPPMPASASRIDVGSLAFRASPLLSDEESQELFEANVQLAGLLPVRVEIVHNSGDAIEIKKLRFQLRDGAGASWKAVSAKQAIGRILKANGVYAYNPKSRRTFEKEFGSYELDVKSPLTHTERRRTGFLFFQSTNKEPVASPRGLILSVTGLAQPVNLALN